MDLNKEKIKSVNDFLNEMMADCFKEMNWHQRLIFRINMKIDDAWLWILMHTKYRKYRNK